MNLRRTLLLLFFTALFVGGSYVAARRETLEQTWYDLADRLQNGGTALAAPTMMTPEEQVAFWSAYLGPNSGDYIKLTYLAQAHLGQARVSGDADAYARAEATLERALAINPRYAPAGALLAAVHISNHRFAEALATAEAVYAADPDQLQALATLGDAHLELGNYEQAAEAYRKLSTETSDPSALSRMARLAWLQGDPAGAIETMRRAAEATAGLGVEGEESAWYRFQLGELYFNSGDVGAAERWYRAAAEALPGYYLAEVGLGKAAAARGDLDEAIRRYTAVVNRLPQPDLAATLGDLHALNGNHEAAQQQYDTVLFIAQLEESSRTQLNRQLALFLANHDLEPEKALRLAEAELAARRDVYTYDALAWALLKNGRPDEAAAAMDKALAQGTQDALLFYHAGMIAAARGDAARAETMLSAALDLNPHFDFLQATNARAALDGLR